MYWALTALLFSRPTGHVHCKGPLIGSPKNGKVEESPLPQKKKCNSRFTTGVMVADDGSTQTQALRFSTAQHRTDIAKSPRRSPPATRRLIQMHNIIFASPATIDRQETVLLLGGKSQSPARVFHCTVGAWGKRRTDPWPWVSWLPHLARTPHTPLLVYHGTD